MNHGTNSTYSTHGCRCEACKTAHAGALRAWRLRSRQPGYESTKQRRERYLRNRKDVRNPHMGPMPATDTAWKERAACDGMSELFFSGVGEARKAEEAKKICVRCPVRADCLDYALKTRQKFGVWGGLAPKERRSLYREAS